MLSETKIMNVSEKVNKQAANAFDDKRKYINNTEHEKWG